MSDVTVEVKVSEQQVRSLLPADVPEAHVEECMKFLEVHLPIMVELEVTRFLNFVIYGDNPDETTDQEKNAEAKQRSQPDQTIES
jgi:hypothetical protein